MRTRTLLLCASALALLGAGGSACKTVNKASSSSSVDSTGFAQADTAAAWKITKADLKTADTFAFTREDRKASNRLRLEFDTSRPRPAGPMEIMITPNDPRDPGKGVRILAPSWVNWLELETEAAETKEAQASSSRRDSSTFTDSGRLQASRQSAGTVKKKAAAASKLIAPNPGPRWFGWLVWLLFFIVLGGLVWYYIKRHRSRAAADPLTTTTPPPPPYDWL